MKAADIPDTAFVKAVATIQEETGCWAVWGYDGNPKPDLQQAFPRVPFKVLLAKARKLVKRGLVTGCACGCRGDFEVTEKGRALIE